MDDLFLKIISGEIPSHKVYEDEHTFAFLDIHPHNKGHVLVIPKKQYRNLFDIPADTLCNVMHTVKIVAGAIKDATGANGISISMSNEAAAGQEVFHAHVHIVPRFTNDRVYASPRQLEYQEGEMDRIAKQIRSKISYC